MSLLSVAEVLGRNEVASAGLVKGWLMRRIEQEKEEVATDQQLIHLTVTRRKRSSSNSRISGTRSIREYSMSRGARNVTVKLTFQAYISCVTIAIINGMSLLVFLNFWTTRILNIFHIRCLLENETACPLCTCQHGIVQEIWRNNE
ncbi:hypothetical protein BS17DRAFT_193547 [Gyrodon lividus]|nr:hypothetical protein BS17DRAFT_193547 [Gyrodon lividus]